MRIHKLLDRRILIVFGFLFFVAGGGVANTNAQTVFVACTWDKSSIFKDPAGRDKFERRFYVAPVVSMTKEDFLRIDRQGDRLEGLCGEYVDKTVFKAAQERSERLDTSGQLRIRRGLELSGEDVGSKNMYKFSTREAIQKLVDADIKEMEDASRFILKFNWDPTGKAETTDLANERKRTLPTAKP